MEQRVRNPFRSEADAFRVLIMFVAGGALVVAAAVLINGLVGALLGLALIAIGGWRAFGLFQDWRRLGSDPTREPEQRSGE